MRGWSPALSLLLLLALLLPLFLPAPIPEAHSQKYFLRFDSHALKGLRSYSGDPGSRYIASRNFSFMVYESQQKTYEIYFLTEPPDVGSITFYGTTYTNGQSGAYTAGTYQIEANVPKGYIFYNWVATGGVSVADSESRQTTASVTGSGSLVAVFKWFVKLRGTVISHVQYTGGWPAIDVKVEELLLDTSNRLKIGEVVEVYRETPFTEISNGDRVEVYGLGFWIGNPPGGPYVEHGIVIKSPEHYVKKIEGKATVTVYTTTTRTVASTLHATATTETTVYTTVYQTTFSTSTRTWYTTVTRTATTTVISWTTVTTTVLG